MEFRPEVNRAMSKYRAGLPLYLDEVIYILLAGVVALEETRDHEAWHIDRTPAEEVKGE